MITIETDYALDLLHPRSSFTQIYFEAVANAFDAGADEIAIRIVSDGKINPVGQLEITISDNGIGFTDERFERFCVVKRPQDAHHKSVGRYVYLSYFSAVHVTSRFDGQQRSFTFSKDFDRQSELSKSDEKGNLTCLRFAGFAGERLKAYEDINPGSLREQLIQQFLPMLFDRKKRARDFRIKIELQTESANEKKDFFPDAQVITAADIPPFETKTVRIQADGSFQVPDMQNGHEVVVSYFLKSGMGEKEHFVAASIDGRTIPFTNLLPASAIPPNHSAIFLLESEAFGKPDTSRQSLVLPDDITLDQLNRVLRREIAAVLSEKIPEISDRNTETKKQFEERYPHLTGYFDEQSVGVINKEEAIETAQRRFLRDQKKVLESDSLDDATFHKSLEVSSRTLTEYILYREKIIKRLAAMSAEDSETDIHNLIVPRYRKYHQDRLLDGIYSNNAWLLDDKFMSFRTVLSEARMHDVISAITLGTESVDDDGRPDIAMIFSADPEEVQSVDVVVIEIKKRTVDDKEGPYAATQLVKRARKLVDHCPKIQRIWYFAIIEINAELSQLLTDMNWAPIFSKGKVFYQDFQVKRADGTSVPTPTCLLSFDAVISDAAARNHTFLEILKHDIRQVKIAQQNGHGQAFAP